jgi:hypothetical protein
MDGNDMSTLFDLEGGRNTEASCLRVVGTKENEKREESR